MSDDHILVVMTRSAILRETQKAFNAGLEKAAKIAEDMAENAAEVEARLAVPFIDAAAAIRAALEQEQ